MSIKDRLQLILITYNRDNHVKNTLTRLMAEDSAVKELDLLIIDNNSTDNTAKIVEEYRQKYSNISYIKNKYNVGLAGNIFKALEVASKDYVWILGDDDLYDFSNWSEVEQAICNNEKMICVARYILPDDKKNNIACQLFQLTFITGGIYSTSLFNDVTIKNSIDNVYTLFPHMPSIIQYINSGGSVYVVNKAISDNGMNVETTDVSYTRGIKNKAELYDRTNEMTWVLGYANIVSLLKDKELQEECMEVAIPYKDIYGSWENFYKCIQNQYINSGKINYFLEIYNVLSDKHKKRFDFENAFVLAYGNSDLYSKLDILSEENKYLSSKINELSAENRGLNSKVNNIIDNNQKLLVQLNHLVKCADKPTFMEKIFSVKNEKGHKVWRVLGIKMKFRRKK